MSKLPTEIIADILSRLPLKPLCRFKCVAKPWYSLINSPIFIKLHLNQTLISQNPNLLICSDSIYSAEIPLSNPSINLEFSELNHLPHTPTVRLIGSCYGILCISDPCKNTVFFYNPLTKTHRLIPPAPTRIPLGENLVYDVVFGFGYDEISDDYMLLRVIQSYENHVQTAREVGLFSLRSNSWKCVHDDLIDYRYKEMNGVLVDGVLYFAVSDKNGKRVIKCFSLGNETFSVLEMFEHEKSFDKFSFSLVELGGCLTVMANYSNHECEECGCLDLSRVDLWVMKESWVRVFSITNLEGIGRVSHIKPVVYSKDGKMILLELDGTKHYWYDLDGKKFESIIANGLPLKNKAFDTYTFVGSIVSLKTDKEKTKDEGELLEGISLPDKNLNKKKSDGSLKTEGMTSLKKIKT